MQFSKLTQQHNSIYLYFKKIKVSQNNSQDFPRNFLFFFAIKNKIDDRTEREREKLSRTTRVLCLEAKENNNRISLLKIVKKKLKHFNQNSKWQKV